MSKSMKFEDVLDECLERLLVKNETVEQCLRSFPEYSDQLKPLLETALAARTVSAIQPRAEFRNIARQQFKSALQEKGRQKSRDSFNWGWQPRWATALAIVLILSLAGGGTVYAAAGSMPDSPLYPVKMATEQVQLALTFSELGKAEMHSKLANKRVTEIVYLADKNEPEKLALTTEKMNSNLREVTALVSTPEVASGAAIAPVLGQVATADETQAPKQPTAPHETSAPAQAPTALTVPTTTPPQVTATPKAQGTTSQEDHGDKVTPAPVKSEKEDKEASQKADQRAKLKTTVESHAASNNARLRASLETAPESAKEALQKALDQSETEYEKAIEALK